MEQIVGLCNELVTRIQQLCARVATAVRLVRRNAIVILGGSSADRRDVAWIHWKGRVNCPCCNVQLDNIDGLMRHLIESRQNTLHINNNPTGRPIHINLNPPMQYQQQPLEHNPLQQHQQQLQHIPQHQQQQYHQNQLVQYQQQQQLENIPQYQQQQQVEENLPQDAYDYLENYLGNRD